MAFTVPASEPPLATGLSAGDLITASSMDSLVQRDRYLFATRRRLLASLHSVTTSSATYEAAFRFRVKTLPTATDTILIGFVTTGSASIRVNSLYGITVITATGASSIIGSQTGIPTDTWFEVVIEVKSNTGGAVTIHGIYIAEQVLTASDLP